MDFTKKEVLHSNMSKQIMVGKSSLLLMKMKNAINSRVPLLLGSNTPKIDFTCAKIIIKSIIFKVSSVACVKEDDYVILSILYNNDDVQTKMLNMCVKGSYTGSIKVLCHLEGVCLEGRVVCPYTIDVSTRSGQEIPGTVVKVNMNCVFQNGNNNEKSLGCHINSVIIDTQKRSLETRNPIVASYLREDEEIGYNLPFFPNDFVEIINKEDSYDHLLLGRDNKTGTLNDYIISMLCTKEDQIYLKDIKEKLKAGTYIDPSVILRAKEVYKRSLSKSYGTFLKDACTFLITTM